MLAVQTAASSRVFCSRQKERARAVADKQQERLEAEQAAQRQAAYEAARSAEDARKQDLIAKQQVSRCGVDSFCQLARCMPALQACVHIALNLSVDTQAKDQQLHELYNQREHSNRRKMLLRDIALQEKKVKVLLADARLSSGPSAIVSHTCGHSTPTSATLMPLQVEQNQRKEAYQRNQVRLQLLLLSFVALLYLPE